MARKKIKTKEENSSRKDDLDPSNDEFIQKTTTALDWAYDRRRPIGVAIILVLLVWIGLIMMGRYRDGLRAEASAVLATALDAATAPVIVTPEGEKPLEKKDGVVFFETIIARGQDSLQKYEKVDAGSFKALRELGIAAAHFDTGEYDKAITSYKSVIDSGEDLEALMPSIQESLGLAYEAAGKLDEAQKEFSKLMNNGNHAVAQIARYNAARIAIVKGKTDEAKELLGKLMKDYSKAEGKLSSLDYIFMQGRKRLLEIDPEADVPPEPMVMDENMMRMIRQYQQQPGGMLN